VICKEQEAKMFGPNQFDTLVRAERMHLEELLREAEAWRRGKAATVQAPPVYRVAAWKLGAVLVDWGERLVAEQPVVGQKFIHQNR
jgi:tRNA A-37 threonylcarbamoyl transferase component Bud32